ncbi:MAG: hypothetical protein EOP34_03485 [Rickettsiales bacterium]|nr:MAG: hypothetical protein EOP34_03485 [Rickettsiales bacterium]
MILSDIVPSICRSKNNLADISVNKVHIFPQCVSGGDLFITIPSKEDEIEILKIHKAIAMGAKVTIKRFRLLYTSFN